MDIDVCIFSPPDVYVSMWAIVWDGQVPYAFMFFGDDGIYIVGQGEEFTRLYMSYKEEMMESLFELVERGVSVFDRYRIEFIGVIPKGKPTGVYICRRGDGSRVVVLPLENRLLVYGSESPEEIENIINVVRRFMEQKAKEG